MRISTRRGWLAVVALALGTANGDHVNFTTGFTSADSANNLRAILEYIPGNRTFIWTSSVVVNEVVLWRFDITNSTPDAQVATGTRRGDFGSNPEQFDRDTDSFPTTPTWIRGFSEQPTIATNPQGRRSPINGPTVYYEKLEVYSDKNGGQVKIPDVTSWVDVNKPFYFQAVWNNGSSYSRAFTFAPPGEASTVVDPVYSNPNPHHNETVSNNAQIPTSTGGGAPQDPNGSSGLGLTPSTPTNSSTASNSGGGLSSGAVIGIAVACGVVGLLLVFALVWYLLRRRQQKKAMGGHPVDSSYGPGNRRADELMAEKEAAADVDVAPHSPYSDEGGSGSAAGPSGGVYQDGSGSGAAGGEAVAAGAVAAGAGAAAAASFTPYSDRPGAAAPSVAAGTPSLHAASVVQTDEPHVSVPSATPGRATPRALTTPYAHLVEEGMTEEEIRRLEEEERQLDAAIEQAGRR